MSPRRMIRPRLAMLATRDDEWTVQRLRNVVNYASGWLLGYGLLAFVIILDPLRVYADYYRNEVPDLRQEVIFCLLFGGISIASFRLFAHPRLEVYRRHVVVVGVLKDIIAPLTAITGIDATSGTYVRLRIQNRHYSVPGLEVRNLGTLSRMGPLEQLASMLPRPVEFGDEVPTTPVFDRLTRFEPAEVVLLSAWVSYVSIGLILYPG